MTRSNFLRWSFNDQYAVLQSEENFRRYVCENLDEIESEAGARFGVILAVLVLQTVLLGLILWRVW
ncbi:hypothetical protein XI03_25855 [Bradyrhizobium sp. CCBAU 65884]|nr:hypothetical protein [Bradyrhizobium sp. CCBAU 65884]